MEGPVRVRVSTARLGLLLAVAFAACAGCVTAYPLGVALKNETQEPRSVYLYTFTAPVDSDPKLVGYAKVDPRPETKAEVVLVYGTPRGYLKAMAFDRGGHLVEEWTHPLELEDDDHLRGFELSVTR